MVSVIGTGMTLGAFVRERRRALGMIEQKDLMRRLPNRDRSWLSRIENNDFKHPLPPDAIADLAAALECSQADLLEAAGFDVKGDCSESGTREVILDWDDPTMQLWSATGQMYTPEEREYLAKILNREAKGD